MAHVYPVGTVVTCNVSYGQPSTKIELFTIEAQMPPVGTSLQYRIKNETEAFRRVVFEHQLNVPGSPSQAGPGPVDRPHPGEAD